MKTIKPCEFNIDNAYVEILYDNGGKVSIYTPMIEESLRTTVYSRSKLDWMIENEPLEYARMVINGTLQDYLDDIADTSQEQLRSYTECLAKRFPPNIAEDIARDMLMYS
ncbi:MAG: DUF6061 family protein [Oscillospiraceae bacterium]|nr:DUF6061 family protein [Oscillospiraceae bacterium]